MSNDWKYVQEAKNGPDTISKLCKFCNRMFSTCNSTKQFCSKQCSKAFHIRRGSEKNKDLK